MGFEVRTRYRILQGMGLPAAGLELDGPGGRSPGGPPAFTVRPFEEGDVESLLELDRLGTGEDRSHAIRRLVGADTTRVVPGADGRVDAFVIRAPWGGGATVARTPDAALAILTARRRAAGLEGRVRVGLLDENAEGLERLMEVGLRLMWSAPRMTRGEPLTWRPEWIWGQFNHAMG
jgi:hypothetical protein